MGTLIQTRLNPDSPIKIKGRGYYLDLELPADVTKKARAALTKLIEAWMKDLLEAQKGLKPEEICFSVSKGAIGLSDKGNLACKKTALYQQKMKQILSQEKVTLSLPDPKSTDQAESSLEKKQRAKLTFGAVSSPHPLDKISYPRKPKRSGESDANWIRRCTQELAGKKYDPKSKKTQASLIGVSQSVAPRQNYQMRIDLQDSMQSFFQEKDHFESREILAKNGYTDGAVASSYNRFADRPTLLRAIEAEDGSIDCIAGRAFDLKSATDVASFAFLSQIKMKNQSLAQGITKEGDVYTFEFAIHSLLPHLSLGSLQFSETKMVYQEIKAYEELAKKTISIPDPEDPGKSYKVRMKPLPVTACQFNHMEQMQKIIPSAFSGEYEAWKISQASDQLLIEKAKKAAQSSSDPDFTKQLNDTAYFLQQQLDANPLYKEAPFKLWQLQMIRAYLCHLLKIPVVVHCKSCVDRTNVENAMISAMKQWIRSGRKIPQKDGRFAVFEMAKIACPYTKKDGTRWSFFPFKELFAYNLHKGLKITELSRAEKGYKFNRGWAQHPTLCDLLPARYIKKREVDSFRRWVLPLCLVFLPLFLVQCIAWIGFHFKGDVKDRDQVFSVQKKKWEKGHKQKLQVVLGTLLVNIFEYVLKELLIVCTFGYAAYKFVKHADVLSPGKYINEEYREVGSRYFLHGKPDVENEVFQDSDS